MASTVQILNRSPNALFETLRSLPFGSVLTSYVTLGSPLSHASNLTIISNTLSVGITLSWDGVTDIIYIPSSTVRVVDLGSMGLRVAAGTQWYVKRDAGAPAAGGVYLESLYA